METKQIKLVWKRFGIELTPEIRTGMDVAAAKRGLLLKDAYSLACSEWITKTDPTIPMAEYRVADRLMQKRHEALQEILESDNETAKRIVESALKHAGEIARNGS